MVQKVKLENVMIWDEYRNCFQCGSLTFKDAVLENIVFGPDKCPADKKKWIVPGFTDCHIHLIGYGSAQSLLKLDRLPLEDIQKKVKIRVKEAPRFQWVHGRGWEAACRRQGGFPDRLEIDEFSQDNPVALTSKDGHSLWLNSRALFELSIDDSVSDPQGGSFDRRPDGSLTGVLRETAVDIVRQKIPARPDSEKRNFLRKALGGLHAKGIIAVHSFEGVSELDLLIDMSLSGELPLKTMVFINLEDFDQVISRGYKFGDRWSTVHLGGLKLYADGALGSRTAAISKPYTDEPENRGIEVMGVEQLTEMSMWAASHGFPTSIHAIGDRAVKHALQALMTVRKSHPNVKGLRIEHAQLVAQEDIEKFAKYDICASVQPCHLISDIDMVERFWSDQEGLFYPYRSLVESGAGVVFGSDAPIDDENPLHYLEAAVTRRRTEGQWSRQAWHPEECMSVTDALKAMTSAPATLENIAAKRGLLKPGYPADLVVLDNDPINTRGRDIKVEAVYADGVRLI
ncbi:MAG: amidohydrolase [bacterium]